MNKTTPSNCKYRICPWNKLPPPENSQECICCAGNKEDGWCTTHEGEQP